MLSEELDGIAQRVREHRGLLSVTMGELRDAAGFGKLGSNVVQRISQELANRGIRHFPRHLPTYQWEVVRLYESDSVAARLIKAAVTPGREEDEVLRKALSVWQRRNSVGTAPDNGQEESREPIERIRELLMEAVDLIDGVRQS
ncbi:MAG: hypothetical protein AB1609_18465 [Bacillota bacterium]